MHYIKFTTHTKDLLESIIRNDNNKFVTLKPGNETIGFSCENYIYLF